MLTVLSAAYPFAPVSPDAVGGAEQVLAAIDRALVRAGVRSVVMAPSTSRVCGELEPTTLPDGPLTDEVLARGRARFRAQLREAVARHRPDVVHLHGCDAAVYLPDPIDVPIVVTLHLWPTAYPASLLTRRPGVEFVCVSDAQRSACPVPSRVIRNGIPIDGYRPAPVRGDYVLMLGRICPEKGFHLAIDAASEAGRPAIVAGAVFPYAAHQEYFEHVLRPRLDGKASFVGPLGAEGKRRWLGRAACVAVPSIVPETSSLVAMEALASGTPVVAFSTPALRELIDDGRTGFLVNGVDEMRCAFTRVGRLLPEECRKTAEQRCAAAAMTAAYLGLYQTLAVPPSRRRTRRRRIVDMAEGRRGTSLPPR